MLQDNQEKTVSVEDEEISLIDLFAVLLKRKWMIFWVTFAAGVFSVLISIISLVLPPEDSFLPNKYKITANMLINDSDSGGIKLSGGMSAAASLLGLDIGDAGSSKNSSLVLYLTTSNPFYDAVAEKFNLYEEYEFKKSPITNMRKKLKKMFDTNFDDKSGVLSISFNDIDPKFAVEVVNYSVDWVSDRLDELGVDNNKISKENLEKNADTSWNEILSLTKELADMQDRVAQGRAVWTKNTTIEQMRIELELSAQKEVYTQLRSQLELLKVKMQTEAPVFQILERPSVPDMKSEPSRGKLCIIITFAAFFLAIFMAFFLNAVENIKNDPEAMRKLKDTSARGNKK